MRKITGGYGAKKNCYVGIACFFFFLHLHISLVSHYFSNDFFGKGATTHTLVKQANESIER